MRSGRLAVVAATTWALACGGEVDSGKSGSGGAGAGGAGQGGSVVGGGGAPAGGGGTGGAPCPPVAGCNWCGGTPKHDAQGCVSGWTCANGIDPCQQGPCQGDCPPGQSCAPDGLCWPDTNPPTCSAKDCSDMPYDCSCKWSCSNGNEYGYHCWIGSMTQGCSCLQNGNEVDSCSWSSSDGGSPSACPLGDSCCGKLPK